MEGCPVYASIVTLRPEQENTNFHSNQQQTSFLQPQLHFTTQRSGPVFFFLWHCNHILTSRTCFTTASEAPNRSTPEMPRTSVSTAPGDKFFFLRPGSNIYSPTHTGDRLQITQEHPHTGEGREWNNIKTATQKHICDI